MRSVVKVFLCLLLCGGCCQSSLPTIRVPSAPEVDGIIRIATQVDAELFVLAEAYSRRHGHWPSELSQLAVFCKEDLRGLVPMIVPAHVLKSPGSSRYIQEEMIRPSELGEQRALLRLVSIAYFGSRRSWPEEVPSVQAFIKSELNSLLTPNWSILSDVVFESTAYELTVTWRQGGHHMQLKCRARQGQAEVVAGQGGTRQRK